MKLSFSHLDCSRFCSLLPEAGPKRLWGGCIVSPCEKTLSYLSQKSWLNRRSPDHCWSKSLTQSHEKRPHHMLKEHMLKEHMVVFTAGTGSFWYHLSTADCLLFFPPFSVIPHVDICLCTCLQPHGNQTRKSNIYKHQVHVILVLV